MEEVGVPPKSPGKAKKGHLRRAIFLDLTDIKMTDQKRSQLGVGPRWAEGEGME